jgi:hypothetical protein
MRLPSAGLMIWQSARHRRFRNLNQIMFSLTTDEGILAAIMPVSGYVESLAHAYVPQRD